jgi:hypothetical protein
MANVALGETRWQDGRPMILISVSYALEPHSPAMLVLTYVDQVDAEDRMTEGIVTT